MEKLKELVDLITRNKVKSINIIGNPSDRDTKLMQFYDGLQNGSIKSDQDALELLYPENGLSKNAYYKLKHTLRDRLFNTLYFIDVKKEKYGDPKEAKLSLQSVITTYNLLFNNAGRKNAIDIAKKGLKVARKFDLMEEAFYLAMRLRLHYSFDHGDQKKFKHFDKLTQKYRQILEAESKAEGFVLHLISLSANNTDTDKAELLKQAEEYLKQLNAIEPPPATITFIFHKTYIEIFKYLGIPDYDKAAQLAKKTIDLFRTYRFLNTDAILAISTQFIICCTQLKRCKDGEEAVQYCLSFTARSSFNWFKIKELHLLLCLQTGQYQKAYLIIKDLIANKKFRKHYKTFKGIWCIYFAWLQFLKASGLIVVSADKKLIPVHFFDIQMMDKIPPFSARKLNLNFPLIICQIIWWFSSGDQKRVKERIRALSKYRNHQLTERGAVFIQFLQKAEEKKFAGKELELLVQRTTQNLRKILVEVIDQNSEIEVVPYEDILTLLKKKTPYTKSNGKT